MTERHAECRRERGGPEQPGHGAASSGCPGDRHVAHMPTVLVVDDDPDIVALLTDALVGRGYRVLASAGAHALHLARRARPAVILLDLTMPQLDGAEVCRRLRVDPATAAVPIILMSADERLGSVAATLAVNDLLAKPFRLGDLFAAVARWAARPGCDRGAVYERGATP